MTDVDLLLRVGQIIMAVVVAAAPPFYPQWSRYRPKADKGIERLTTHRDCESDRRWVEKGDTGFEQLVQAIDYGKTVPGEIDRVITGHYGSINTATVGSAMVQNRTVLHVEYADKEDSDMLTLAELQRKVESYTTHRSHRWTTGLAVLWSAVAVASL